MVAPKSRAVQVLLGLLRPIHAIVSLDNHHRNILAPHLNESIGVQLEDNRVPLLALEDPFLDVLGEPRAVLSEYRPPVPGNEPAKEPPAILRFQQPLLRLCPSIRPVHLLRSHA